MYKIISILLISVLCLFIGTSYGEIEVKIIEEEFVRNHGEPIFQTFDFQSGSGTAILSIQNASPDPNRNQKVRVAYVKLNGQMICSPSNFNQNIDLLETTVNLIDGTNILEVKLNSKPKTKVSISLTQYSPYNISKDVTWAGTVFIDDRVEVLPNVTLRILPGTQVVFKNYRGYKEPQKRLRMVVRGKIISEGTAENPVYFTSDAPDPQNGDWSMLRLRTPTDKCFFYYTVFEFAQHGLNIWQGDALISHCVFRWNNWEGIYFESNSNIELEYCQIYENGYNGLAAEQFNTFTMDYCDVWRNGTNGIHVDASTLEILRSHVHDNKANGLSVDDNGTLKAHGVALYDNAGWGLGIGEGTNTVEVSNVYAYGNPAGDIQTPHTVVASSYYHPSEVDIGFEPYLSYALDYIPGDQLLDKYMYVYPDDETRKIVYKIGQGLGLTWSVAWDGSNIWTSTVGGKIYKLDPITGNVIQQFTAPGAQPWGLTFDGKYLWLVDFAEKRISKIDPANGLELATFPTPDPVGGCKGVTWDGTYLYVMGWTSPKIYKMDTNGNHLGTIPITLGGGGIAWDGNHFWIPGDGIIYRYDNLGNNAGWIYAASEGTWDMTWDGTYLWATQRTNENWSDNKIFALEILQIKQ
jgi:glutamine cyclotransferase